MKALKNTNNDEFWNYNSEIYERQCASCSVNWETGECFMNSVADGFVNKFLKALTGRQYHHLCLFPEKNDTALVMINANK
jgi:hypothetical protein